MKNRSFILFILSGFVFLSCSKDCADKCERKVGGVSRMEVAAPQLREGEDPYLRRLYRSINDSPMQQKLRNMKPFPVGVVYYQQQGDGIEEIKKEFEKIKDCGFTALKQVQLFEPYKDMAFEQEVFRLALEVGISPWYYGKGGWINITPQLVKDLGIELECTDANMPAIQDHPKMLAYQKEMLMKRIERMPQKPEKPEGMGEPGRNSPYLTERLIPLFAKWLEKEYKGDIEALKKAWNGNYTGGLQIKTFMEAALKLKTTRVDEYGNRWGERSWDFRRMRDAMRFQADLIIDNYKEVMEMYNRWDFEEPERTGGHQIFENQAVNSWDMEAQAQSAKIGGSFYSSIHLAHHFFLVKGETTKPVYMQARHVADMFKGGWAATWESTGGPTTWSGMDPYTVDGNTMRQLMMSYLAAGLKGIGFWMWNSRGEGWETGEYALADIQGEPSERAIVAGGIAKTLQQQRFELWESDDEPTVGILYSWENEAMLGRLSLGSYPLNTPVYHTDRDAKFRQYHQEGRIGLSRTLMNHSIPFEYATERDLEAGLAGRYEVIYLPYMLALSDKHLDILMKYVESGGNIIADFPVLMLDEYGRLNKHLKGSKFEKLFGVQTADYYHTFNHPLSLDGLEIKGQFGELKVSTAEVKSSFSDGRPAVTVNRYGKGSVTLLNYEATRMVFEPGNTAAEAKIMESLLATGARVPYKVQKAKTSMVFRRSAPDADHYFIINEGAAEKIAVTSAINYSAATELIDKTEVPVSGKGFEINVPGKSAVWVRCTKSK